MEAYLITLQPHTERGAGAPLVLVDGYLVIVKEGVVHRQSDGCKVAW